MNSTQVTGTANFSTVDRKQLVAVVPKSLRPCNIRINRGIMCWFCNVKPRIISIYFMTKILKQQRTVQNGDTHVLIDY